MLMQEQVNQVRKLRDSWTPPPQSLLERLVREQWARADKAVNDCLNNPAPTREEWQQALGLMASALRDLSVLMPPLLVKR